VFAEGSVILGVPADIKRQVTEKEKEHIEENAASYVELANRYREMSPE
jgi:carbonic anhydrase/acetyltransferase-like protein (isoleucine patch superfamily)